MKREQEKEKESDEQINKKKKTSYIPTLERCLNDLAWVLEQADSSCTAICLVKSKLLVTDNSFFNNSYTHDKLPGYIDYPLQVIKFLDSFIATIDENKKRECQTNLLKYVLLAKVNSIFQGRLAVKLDEKLKQLLISYIFDNLDTTVGKSQKEFDYKHSKVETAALIELGRKVARRLDRITQTLNRMEGRSLSDAIKNWKFEESNEPRFIRLTSYGASSFIEKEWMMDDSKAGCAFILTNFQDVHAELKIIDYLMASRLLTFDNANTLSYSIGISKKCCTDCNNVVSVINHIKPNSLKITDNHSLSFSKWSMPIFLLNPNQKSKVMYEKGLAYCVADKSVGYYHVGLEKTEALMSIEDITKLNIPKEQVYLYRDHILVSKIQEEYTALNLVKEDKKEVHTPMSQSSPTSSEAEQLHLSSAEIVSSLDNVSTDLLIGELIARFEEDKCMPSEETESLINMLKRSKTYLIAAPNSKNTTIAKKFELIGKHIGFLFSEIGGIKRQVKCNFHGGDILFDVFETKGDGNCGFYSLPIPYDRQGVKNLLMNNSDKESIRKLVSNEIISALYSKHLPQVFLKNHELLASFIEYQAKTDNQQAALLGSILNEIDPKTEKIKDRQFEKVIAYLSNLKELTFYEKKSLALLLKFKKEHDDYLDSVKLYCQKEAVYKEFVETYIGGQGELSFSIKGETFEKEKSFLDAILELTQPPIKLYIWELVVDSNKEKTQIAHVVYEGGSADGTPTHVLHQRGLQTHFELMAQAEIPLPLEKPKSGLGTFFDEIRGSKIQIPKQSVTLSLQDSQPSQEKEHSPKS